MDKVQISIPIFVIDFSQWKVATCVGKFTCGSLQVEFGFSLACVLWCLVRLLLIVNSSLQKSHGYGFSPVCVL